MVRSTAGRAPSEAARRSPPSSRSIVRGRSRSPEMTGSLKVWRTADGKYRKEEQVGPYSSIETFDGTKGFVQEAGSSPRPVTGAELGVFLSKSFANWSAVFFVFFPERRHGSTRIDADDTIAFTPEGGIEWLVTLDPQTSLPKTMMHKEGDRTITVSFTSYETVGAFRDRERDPSNDRRSALRHRHRVHEDGHRCAGHPVPLQSLTAQAAPVTTSAACSTTPAAPPTRLPLRRMNCRSGPSSVSIFSVIISASQRCTTSVMSSENCC